MLRVWTVLSSWELPLPGAVPTLLSGLGGQAQGMRVWGGEEAPRFRELVGRRMKCCPCI